MVFMLDCVPRRYMARTWTGKTAILQSSSRDSAGMEKSRGAAGAMPALLQGSLVGLSHSTRFITKWISFRSPVAIPVGLCSLCHTRGCFRCWRVPLLASGCWFRLLSPPIRLLTTSLSDLPKRSTAMTNRMVVAREASSRPASYGFPRAHLPLRVTEELDLGQGRQEHNFTTSTITSPL